MADIEVLRAELIKLIKEVGSDRKAVDLLRPYCNGFPPDRSTLGRFRRGTGSPTTLAMTVTLIKLALKAEYLKINNTKPILHDIVKNTNTYIPKQEKQMHRRLDSQEPLLTYFQDLIPDKADRCYVLNFIAHLVQHPNVKIPVMPILEGPEGVGKSLVLRCVIADLLQPVNQVGNAHQLVAFDDITGILTIGPTRIGKSIKLKEGFIEVAKKHLSGDLSRINPRGKPAYNVKNTTSYIGCTSQENPLGLTEHDRRFKICKTTKKVQSETYYSNFVTYCLYNQSVIEQFFLNREICFKLDEGVLG